MFRTTRLLPSVIGAAGVLSAAALTANGRRRDKPWQAAPSSAEVSAVVKRLGSYLDVENPGVVTQRVVKRDVAIYGITDEEAHRAAGGLMVVRVARTVIKAPVEEVAACWWRVGSRKDWDSVNTIDSQLVKAVAPDTRLIYLQGKPKAGGVVSSRDFAYTMYRRPPQDVGAHLGSVVFVQVNSAGDVPGNKASVRGDVNSLLLLEPLDPGTTRATYAIEMDVKGWLPTRVVQAAADETPLTLAAMRDFLEAGEEQQGGLSPEDAAKQRALKQRQDEEGSRDVIHSAARTRPELLAAKALMEDRLKALRKEERASGLDLSELRVKIQADLRDINRRL